MTSKNKKNIIEKNTLCQNLGDVYKDINAIKIEETDSFDTLLKKFYAVMTKHGICQGTWSGNGRTIANPEWCMCWFNFKSHIEAQFNWMYLMSNPPKRLLAYGKKPRTVAYKIGFSKMKYGLCSVFTDGWYHDIADTAEDFANYLNSDKIGYRPLTKDELLQLIDNGQKQLFY